MIDHRAVFIENEARFGHIGNCRAFAWVFVVVHVDSDEGIFGHQYAPTLGVSKRSAAGNADPHVARHDVMHPRTAGIKLSLRYPFRLGMRAFRYWHLNCRLPIFNTVCNSYWLLKLNDQVWIADPPARLRHLCTAVCHFLFSGVWIPL